MAQANAGSCAVDFAAFDPDDPFGDRRRSSLLMRLASVLLGAFMIAVGIWLLTTGLALSMAAVLIATGLARLPLLWLEACGFATTAALAGNFSAALLFAVALLDIGTEAGLEAWIPVMLAMPVLILGPQHGRLRVAVPLLNLAVAAAAEIVALRLPPYNGLGPGTLGLVRLANVAGAAIMMAGMVMAYRKLLDRAERRVAEEQERSERLLANILPGPIAARLKRGETPIAEGHAAATIMFADIVNFTPFAAKMPADEVVNLLNRLFHAFDDMTDRRGLEKIKTIGDAYMVGGGLDGSDEGGPGAGAVAELACEMLAFAERLRTRHGYPLQLRIGIHTGPLVAGVIGKRKFSYDVWGDTVNTAARLADASEPGRALVSAATAAALGRCWRVEPRGAVPLKGLGEVPAFFLLGRAEALPAAAE